MARPREFDEDAAVARAMETFWRHGYENASLPILLDGMGLTRGSLYKAFSDKKTLFLIALARYEAEAVAPAVALLNAKDRGDGVQRIDALFGAVVGAVRKGDRRGCLLCTTAAGAAATDPDIAAETRRLLNEMRAGFAAALADAPASAPRADSLSAVLTAQYTGLRILARANASLDLIEVSAAETVALVRGSRRDG